MSEDRSATGMQPCRRCGEETEQRADGKPYCSMDCINARRRELRQETYRCPYPGCDWKTKYDPEIPLQRSFAKKETFVHRGEHDE